VRAASSGGEPALHIYASCHGDSLEPPIACRIVGRRGPGGLALAFLDGIDIRAGGVVVARVDFIHLVMCPRLLQFPRLAVTLIVLILPPIAQRVKAPLPGVGKELVCANQDKYCVPQTTQLRMAQPLCVTICVKSIRVRFAVSRDTLDEDNRVGMT